MGSSSPGGRSTSVRSLIVTELEHKYSTRAVLKAVGLSVSTYYRHRSKTPHDRYEQLRPLLREVFDGSYRSYGYRRIRAVLATKHGLRLSGKTVLKLMRQEGRTCQVRRRKRYKSYRGEIGKAAPNVLARNFDATQPSKKWVTDVTEFYVLGQKQYLSPVIDLFNREVISYELAPSPVMGLVTGMLEKAFTQLKPGTGLVMHSDQGWHYRHAGYQLALKQRGITQSMSRKGNCLDNAVAENFFGHFKEEFLRQHTFTSMPQFKRELEKYIHWFNHERIQEKLKGLSPVDYRTQSLANLETTPN
ncbi:IS3 family transposase [Aurantimicrobium photophilum]|uniref:Integrase core domain protein n=1 Tax=Aurantimicrobium photophilum TaxID=1987356 RepID=A0A2Z3RXJ9_9MICO|nr:IS3 family transposase [Aurantimicrobium photophilum]AWR21545.1 Integrase core domain protein [Aurantimicrobium photophilum]